MKYLVTGGAGFIGSHIVDRLINEGNEVVIIDNLVGGNNINPKAELVVLDISKEENQTTLRRKMENTDTVFHCAAIPRVQPSIKNPRKYHKANVDGTFNVLLSARDSGVRRVVYSASSSAYGDQEESPQTESMPVAPMSPYGLQKLIGEQYCFVFSKCYDLQTVSLRYFNIYGERQVVDGAYPTVIGIFLKQKQDREKLTITNDGEQRRDFTYVADAVEANILASRSDKVGHGEVINIGRGSNYSVNEIANIIGGETENIGERPEPRQTLADRSLAEKLLGWVPRTDVKHWLINK